MYAEGLLLTILNIWRQLKIKTSFYFLESLLAYREPRLKVNFKINPNFNKFILEPPSKFGIEDRGEKVHTSTEAFSELTGERLAQFPRSMLRWF
jgi:hypothetical protein